MKQLIILSVFLSACTFKASHAPEKTLPVIPADVFYDTVIVTNTIFITDTVFIEKKYDSLQNLLFKKNDSLFIERYKIERVKYYTKIVQNNSSQIKFLVGWVLRAIRD